MTDNAIMVAKKTGSAKLATRRERRASQEGIGAEPNDVNWATCGRARRLYGIPYSKTDRRTTNSGDTTERRGQFNRTENADLRNSELGMIMRSK